MKSDLTDIDVIFQHATDRAVCVRAEEGGGDVWIPLSVCEVEGDRRRGGVVTLTASERLLTERGLV